METQKGLSVTTTSIEAINSINEFYQQILGSGQVADRILAAAAEHPNCSLIQTYAGIFYLYAQENAATEIAKSYLRQAEKTVRSANLREKLMFYAAKAWAKLDYECAISLLSSILQLYPGDLLALKFAEWLFYCSGQAYQAAQFLNLCEVIATQNQEESYFHAIHSFALELNGRFAEAKETAEKAMELAWAHHTLAHVYLMTNQIETGIKVMEECRPTWQNTLPLLKGHNTWHLALFHLAKLDEPKLKTLFANGIFGDMPKTVLQQIDAISLVWRMDMAGMDPIPLLTEVRPYLEQHPFEYYSGFNSTHFIYALSRFDDNKLADEALNRLEHYTHTLGEGYNQNLWREIHLPFSLATHAFARGDFEKTRTLCAPIIDNCFQLGGSDAQDELFLQMYLVSLLQCKKKDDAWQFFNRYLFHYNNTALASQWFDEGSHGYHTNYAS